MAEKNYDIEPIALACLRPNRSTETAAATRSPRHAKKRGYGNGTVILITSGSACRRWPLRKQHSVRSFGSARAAQMSAKEIAAERWTGVRHDRGDSIDFEMFEVI